MPKPVLTFVPIRPNEHPFYCEAFGLPDTNPNCSDRNTNKTPAARWRRINPATGHGDYVCERHMYAAPHCEPHYMQPYLDEYLRGSEATP